MRIFAPSNALLRRLIRVGGASRIPESHMRPSWRCSKTESRLLTLAYAIGTLSKALRPQLLPVIYPARREARGRGEFRLSVATESGGV